MKRSDCGNNAIHLKSHDSKKIISKPTSLTSDFNCVRLTGFFGLVEDDGLDGLRLLCLFLLFGLLGSLVGRFLGSGQGLRQKLGNVDLGSGLTTRLLSRGDSGVSADLLRL